MNIELHAKGEQASGDLELAQSKKAKFNAHWIR